MTIKSLIIDYFKKHPNQDLDHGPVVDAVTEEWLKHHDKPPRDPWRTIRGLKDSGFLIKVKKGVYRYDPDAAFKRELSDFSPEQKEEIFKRDGYKCVVCGRGREAGVELHADHIKARDLGGTSEISNGQTLCGQHNYKKKNYAQTETGKKMFIRLYELAEEIGDDELMSFCADVLRKYEEHHINDHIKWKP